MQRKPQFHISAERRTFYDRKVLHYGSSRTLAMGKIIPKEWRYVRLSIIEQEHHKLTVTIEQLTEPREYARNPKNDKTGRPDP